MNGNRILYKVEDLPKLEAVIQKWRTERANTPTISSLIRYIGYKSPCSFYENLKRDDEIGDLLKDTYNIIVDFYETKLCSDKMNPNAMFMIKCFNANGWNFREPKENQYDTNKIDKIVFEIVEKKKDETIPTAS